MARTERSRAGSACRSTALLLLVWLAGCGGADGPPTGDREGSSSSGLGGPDEHDQWIETQRVVLPLLARTDLRTIHLAEGVLPVTVQPLRASGSGHGLRGEHPALEMSPPCELSFDIPEGFEGDELTFMTGIRRGNYRGTSTVWFELEYEGEIIFSEARQAGAETPLEDRHWYPASVPIPGPGPLLLRTRYEGDQPTSPSAAFALLEVERAVRLKRLAADSNRPHVILITVDTLRADRMSAYGGPRPTSPHLDGLAERGTLFEWAYSAGPWTSPSTASLMTGLAPPQHGLGFADSVYLSDGFMTLAETFQDAGYTTAAFSCNPLVSIARNFDQGFESFFDFNWTQSEDVLEAVSAWIEEHAERPFFLYLHFVDPHDPYAPAPEFEATYASTPPEGYDHRSIVEFMARFWGGEEFEPEYMRSVAAHNLTLYDGEVASVDATLGRLFEELSQSELLERTVLAVTSDHGEEFYEHGLMNHVNQLHAESVRVPLILAGPGIPVGERKTEPVENRLLGTTLLTLAEIETPPVFGGRDLLSERKDDLVYLTTRNGQAFHPVEQRWVRRRVHGVRSGNEVLFWSPQLEGVKGYEWEHLQLFDVKQDPAALINLAGERPERVSLLRHEIQKWLAAGDEQRQAFLPAGEGDEALLLELGYLVQQAEIPAGKLEPQKD